MSEHKCHCRARAVWFARVVPMREVVLVEGHLPEVVLAARSVDSWATCDRHLADAARTLTGRNSMENAILMVRSVDE